MVASEQGDPSTQQNRNDWAPDNREQATDNEGHQAHCYGNQ